MLEHRRKINSLDEHIWSRGFRWTLVIPSKYCGWFRHPANSPVEVGSWNPIIYGVFLHPPAGCLGFLPSTVWWVWKWWWFPMPVILRIFPGISPHFEVVTSSFRFSPSFRAKKTNMTLENHHLSIVILVFRAFIFSEWNPHLIHPPFHRFSAQSLRLLKGKRKDSEEAGDFGKQRSLEKRNPNIPPKTYPRNPQAPKGKEFLHELLVGGLGYDPDSCWKFSTEGLHVERCVFFWGGAFCWMEVFVWDSGNGWPNFQGHSIYQKEFVTFFFGTPDNGPPVKCTKKMLGAKFFRMFWATQYMCGLPSIPWDAELRSLGPSTKENAGCDLTENPSRIPFYKGFKHTLV